MKMRLRYTIMVCFVVLATSCTKETYVGETGIVPEAENDRIVEQELLSVINDHRLALGYNALDYSSEAQKYADQHNDYMISKGSLSHDNFSSRASSLSSELNAEFVAENVAKDYTNATEAFEGWLQSSNHKKTMEGEFTHTAVSVKKDASGNYYFTQLFFR
ncbi:CAP domain-containing protein [Flavobacteriaceae bacterium TP-CH-4]|uniref:CAP domain-containing protein n=1 Tax=Pelagihabitans pacificus TaxID=2696054 RepID=A0A967E4X8_9FLAO|nr:CAP domain-containing protein [Pelagihabitans pacificus]NHF58847.1 CAP domain-containing protein [Pelagihabitans pacificus]